MQDQELEVKFLVSDLEIIEKQIQGFGATLIQPRTHEINLRFDNHNGDLTKNSKVLRLRQYTDSRLTYKGPGREHNGVRVRQEIEFSVSDFSAAHRMLQALGFDVIMIYEKFRTVYELEDAEILLDEMPFGSFIEIEGPNSETIVKINHKLGLDWQTRVPFSYTVLFDQLQQNMNLDFRDLVFENFEDIRVNANDLGLRLADG